MKKTRYLYNATITNIVDGDTIDASVDLGFRIFVHMRLRLHGINTMELNSTNPSERAQAIAARNYLIDLLLNQRVVLRIHKTDKFGRWLAEVFYNGASVNKMLLNENLAVPILPAK